MEIDAAIDHISGVRGFDADDDTNESEALTVVCDFIESQAATIARLTAEVERAFREGYAEGFRDGGSGFNGYLSMDTEPDPDGSWEQSEAAQKVINDE